MQLAFSSLLYAEWNSDLRVLWDLGLASCASISEHPNPLQPAFYMLTQWEGQPGCGQACAKGPWGWHVPPCLGVLAPQGRTFLLRENSHQRDSTGFNESSVLESCGKALALESGS